MTDGTAQRIYRSREDRVIGGVAGGIGAHLGVDPVLVRISFVALVFAGVGILAYLIAWVVIPEAPYGFEPPTPSEDSGTANSARIIIGTVLVAIGILLLLDAVFPIRRFAWPLALIVIGISVFAYGTRR